jgi:hypothetical protein
MKLIFRWALSALLLTFGVSVWAEKEDEQSTLALLITAKFSGGCGILSQMATFQESTKMEGGDDFLMRFLNTESARLGMSVAQYLEQCRKSGEIYQSYYDALQGTPAP